MHSCFVVDAVRVFVFALFLRAPTKNYVCPHIARPWRLQPNYVRAYVFVRLCASGLVFATAIAFVFSLSTRTTTHEALSWFLRIFWAAILA